MENQMMNGFCEMTEEEMMLLDGGINWNSIGEFLAGTAGAAIGAKIGSGIGTATCPGLGTFVGGAIGGAVGIAVYTLFD